MRRFEIFWTLLDTINEESYVVGRIIQSMDASREAALLCRFADRTIA